VNSSFAAFFHERPVAQGGGFARPDRMLNVPNLITLIRLGLVPVVAYLLAIEAYRIALPTFLVAALSDFADGYIARRFKLTSRLGALLDPVADKLNMAVTTVLLAWLGLLPLWLAIAIVARDVLIVAGALAYRFALGPVKIAPTRLSKINTLLEFALLLLVMAGAAEWIDTEKWMNAAFLAVFASVVASGAQYAWVWGRKARAQARMR
jgi:cardiolipin synthase (CMP-forming)